MQLLRQWIGSSSGPSQAPVSPATPSGTSLNVSDLRGLSQISGEGKGSARALGAGGPGTGSAGSLNGDMRGRNSSVLGSGLGLGFGVAGGSTGNLRATSSKTSTTWTAFEKFFRPWFLYCRPLPPIVVLIVTGGLFLAVCLVLVWVLSSLISWIPSFSIFSRPHVGSVNAVRYTYPLPDLHNLIMVAGHSVYTSTSCEPFEAESSWFLEPYQQITGEAQTFLYHIRLGVNLAHADEQSLLLFSGGETRKNAGPRSEGQSYWFVAEGSKWFGKDGVASRALPEEYARDSFENLLFSMCRFREVTGHYPQNITVVSYDFKQQRFFGAHRTALRFPANRFRFVGTPMVPEGQEGAKQGEEATLAAFKKDPYGCQGTLEEKRQKRDPFARTIPYPAACPELSALFSYCGSRLFRGKLPWDRWGSSRKWLVGSG